VVISSHSRMDIMKKFFRVSFAILSAFLYMDSGRAEAVSGQGTWETTLQARDLNDDGQVDAFYDTDLNLTWLRDANYARSSSFNTDGFMTWDVANVNWIGSLNADGGLFGYTDWRLPTILQPDFTCNTSYDFGPPYGVKSVGSNCTGGEMGHLWYVDLGNTSGLTNTGGFDHFQYSYYWTGSRYGPVGTQQAFFFSGGEGYQNTNYVGWEFFAMAVRPGDIANAVPEPESLLLALTALAALVVGGRRRPDRPLAA